MGTFRQMAGVAADPVVELGVVRNPSPLVHAILALLLLLAATALAIYKPFGMTPYGSRRQLRERATAPALASVPLQAVTVAKSRRWEYLLWLVGLGILGLIILSHLLGSGAHGH